MPSKSKTISSWDQGPWSGQAPFIKDIFKKAKDLYNQQQQNPYTGDYVAQIDDKTKGIIGDAQDWYSTTGIQNADSLYGLSNDLLSFGASGSKDIATRISDFANSDRTANILSDATRLSDNPYISGMVDAAMRDANRNASESTIPNLYRNAAGSNNLNSSRAALAQGVVQRGLAEKTADVSSNLRGDAYKTGLGIGFANQGLTLDALKGAGSIYDQMTARGYGGVTDAYNMRKDSVNSAAGLGESLRNYNQLGIDNELAKRNAGWENLMKYYGIVGDKNWGSSGTSYSQTKQSPGAAQIAGGILGGLGSLFGQGGMFGAGGAFGGPAAAATGSTAGLTSAGASAGGSALGSIGTALSSILGIFSDERSKTDIDHIGVDPDTGLNMYAYRYKTDPKHYPKIVGPMAQEVAQKYPDAVSHVNGMLYYSPGKLL